MISRTALFVRTILLNSLFYVGAGYLPFLVPYPVPGLPLDDLIVFNFYSVYPYFSFFFMIWLAIAAARSDSEARELSILIPASAFLAAFVYIAFPMHVTLDPQDLSSADPVTAAIFHLMRADTSLTYLPSLHGAITVICVAFLGRGRGLIVMCGLVAWAAAIYWSAISLRQHLSLDIFAGMIHGFLILYLRRAILAAVRRLHSFVVKDAR